MVVRRSTLTRDAILSEPEVSSVDKFRFFKLGPSVIESTVLETSSTDDFTIDACVLDPFRIAEMFFKIYDIYIYYIYDIYIYYIYIYYI